MIRMTTLFGAAMLIASAAAAGTISPDAKPIIDQMIAAHGGMDKWRSAPTVSFTEQWLRDGKPRGPKAAVTVEQTSRRAYMDVVGTDTRVAWDGEKAWSENWTMPTPPRFIALLNYYFTNLPWLTMDPGVNLAAPTTEHLWDDPVAYISIRMTFDAGVGDTPDDYYVLLIDPDTKLLHGCRYVVTYKSLMREGKTSSPEHVLIYEDHTTVDGLRMPAHFSIYQTDHSPYAACAFDDWSFQKPFDASRMKMPRGATIDESTP